MTLVLKYSVVFIACSPNDNILSSVQGKHNRSPMGKDRQSHAWFAAGHLISSVPTERWPLERG